MGASLITPAMERAWKRWPPRYCRHHPERRQEARGLCHACYVREWQGKARERRRHFRLTGPIPRLHRAEEIRACQSVTWYGDHRAVCQEDAPWLAVFGHPRAVLSMPRCDRHAETFAIRHHLAFPPKGGA